MTTGPKRASVEELEPKQSVLVYPTSITPSKGLPGAPCPCVCYELSGAEVQNGGSWSGVLSQVGKNQATDYRGYELTTGMTYIGKDNGGTWNWEPVMPWDLDGGVI
ncbi:MAG: hypothetical protein GY887_15925 [Halieaceae bacterium]|jgi:hypothetical protein|nr:hypothetical protein [Halieaceae bacterium]